MTAVTVLGAGSWGTALAIQLATAGCAVTLWARNPTLVSAMREDRANRQYLGDAVLPNLLTPESDWHQAVASADHILVAVPSHALRSTLQQLANSSLRSPLQLSWATKGLELDTGLLPHQVVEQELPACRSIAVLSGPTFALEVARQLPTAITVASPDVQHGETLAGLLSTENFRAYTSSDIAGVEVGGAVKNVLAIGAGLSDGLGFGANARIALINRGLREMVRLGVACGAHAETFMGLAGMGDLVLTCTDNQSRNRRMGLALAQGLSMDEALQDIGQVVEGVSAARAVHQKAVGLGVDMPICEQIYRVLFENTAPRDAVVALLARASGPESI